MHLNTELFSEANTIKEKEQIYFEAFVLSRSTKCIYDLIGNTWKIHNEKASIEPEKTTTMEILMKCQSESFVDGYEMK